MFLPFIMSSGSTMEIALLLISLLKVSAALNCLACDHATTIDQCHVTPCAADEECYMDEVVDDISLFYRAGCRAKDVCRSAISSGKRDTELIACARCCNTPPDNSSFPCNSKLCGIQASAPGARDLNLCYQCSNVYDLNACNGFVTCQHNEVCGTALHDIPGHPEPAYSMGCYSAGKCVKATQQIIQLADRYGGFGRRSVTGCTACCGDSLCNTGDCKKLAEKLYRLYKGGNLNITTLKMH